MTYTYGRVFRRDGKLCRYRYKDGNKSTRKLVAANPKRKYARRVRRK